LLSHGARHILRESATTKAEYSPEAFHALWAGLPIPTPKPTYAYQKFLAMVEGAGVNVHKEGSKMTLLPLTDKDILARSNGQITRAATVNDKADPITGLPFRPEAGGLFDPHVTGGLVGNKWGHITMSEPTVNPVYANPARMLLDMTKAEFATSLADEGGEGIAKRLAAIHPAESMFALTAKLADTNAPGARDVIHKKLRYLNALKRHGLTPDQAYVVHHVPVIPPGYRPIYPDAQTGAIVNSDANRLYQNLMLVSDQLHDHKEDGDPDTVKSLRTGLHAALAAVQGLDGNAEKVAGKDDEAKGFLKIIAGTTSAKEGFFQSKLISRRQDVAGRGVVVPDPDLGIDQIGLPEPMAWKLFRNHAVGELTKAGMPLDAAATHIKDQTDTARRALLEAMRKVPALMSRAPSLHKFSIQAFEPVLVTGKSIRVNNLIHKGFNMDHDGDAVNIHIPLGHEAIAEARGLMPSKNLFNPLNKAPVNTPTNETTMGLWKVTNIQQDATPVKTFASHAEAIAAYERGEIKVDDAIAVGA
jgi:DNA-directed RNA polymerase beta' subunit